MGIMADRRSARKISAPPGAKLPAAALPPTSGSFAVPLAFIWWARSQKPQWSSCRNKSLNPLFQGLLICARKKGRPGFQSLGLVGHSTAAAGETSR
jgi:hypothetical protein